MSESIARQKGNTGVDLLAPMADDAVIYAGDIVRYDADGYLEASVTDTTGTFIVGFALESYDNTDGGDAGYYMPIHAGGIIYIPGSYSRADIGTKFYASTTAKILSTTGSLAVAGTLIEVDANGGFFNFDLK